MTTHISDRNSKLGKVPNISLPPITSCRKDAPCKKECYALKSYRMYPNVKTAWSDNLEMVQNNYTQYWTDISDYLSRKRKPVPFFRWHVSGDIIDTEYLYGMCVILLSRCRLNTSVMKRCFHGKFTGIEQIINWRISTMIRTIIVITIWCTMIISFLTSI